MMSKLKGTLWSLLLLSIGVVIGGYLFSQSQPRSLLAINRCQDCLSAKDLAGLLASAGIQKLPDLIPFVVFETDKTIVIRNPLTTAYVDYIIFPKKDIRNIGEINKEDSSYLIDAYSVARYIIDKEKLTNYQFYTNGPGFQHVTYLHFHLLAQQLDQTDHQNHSDFLPHYDSQVEKP